MTYTTVFDSIPKTITAGESVSWTVSLSDYPASESWVLTYTLVKSDTRIQIISTASEDDHLIEIPFATTSAYVAGEYHYQAHISNTTERYQVGAGTLEILIDFATESDGYDSRTWLDISIDALESSIEGRAGKTQLAQTVGGIQVQHMTLTEQIETVTKLKRMRANKSILKTGGKIMKVKF